MSLGWHFAWSRLCGTRVDLDGAAQTGETVAFDDAVGVALDFPGTAPGHARGGHGRSLAHQPDRRRGQRGRGDPTGYSNNLVTADGQTMRITYGTAGGNPASATPPSQQHTGAVVPVWAAGSQATAVLGTNDHTELFDLLQGKGG
jgi:alkaline phosphatase